MSVLTVLILSLNALVFGWLYLRTLENEKERLTHLSSMHVHHLEAMSQMIPGWKDGAVSQEFFTDPIQSAFDSHKGNHHFGQTGR